MSWLGRPPGEALGERRRRRGRGLDVPAAAPPDLAPRPALLLTLVFAFATSTWVTGSQALWQHGTAELLAVGTLWFVTGEPTTPNLLAAGALAGLMAANRPPDLLLTAAFGLYVLIRVRRRAVWFAAAAAVPGLLAAAYNLTMFRHLGGGYGAIDLVGAGFFGPSLLRGLAGLLVSPARGLFVYSPFLLFLPLLFHRALADRSTRTLTLCLTGGVLLQLCLYTLSDWRGGFSYGYRFLSDMVPILIWMLAPVLVSLGRPARAAFAACCLFSLWVQAIGAFQYTGISDLAINDPTDVGDAQRLGDRGLADPGRKPATAGAVRIAAVRAESAALPGRHPPAGRRRSERGPESAGPAGRGGPARRRRWRSPPARDAGGNAGERSRGGTGRRAARRQHRMPLTRSVTFTGAGRKLLP